MITILSHSKRKSTFIVFISFFIALNAQKVMRPIYPTPKNTDSMTLIDSVHIRILYALNAVDINKPETYDDLQRLDIGARVSKYYSFFVFNSDSLVTAWIKKHPKAQSIQKRLGDRGKKNYWSEYHYSEFFENRINKTFSEYARMPMYMQRSNGKCTELTPTQNWTIYNETQTISGFLCQKAKCRFRGRDYTAWFTKDISINSGPWKFRGLPGLILKVYDDDKLYVFECIKIETFKRKIPMMQYNDYKNYKEINRKELLKLQKTINEDYPKTTGARNYKTKEPLSTPTIYYPIEIE